jgi:hypothetical protein
MKSNFRSVLLAAAFLFLGEACSPDPAQKPSGSSESASPETKPEAAPPDVTPDQAPSDVTPDSSPLTFHGYTCLDDCSGHQAGYDWAEEHSITDPSECSGNSESFIEGCKAYAGEDGPDGDSDDDTDDK